jgi:ABC-type dipeptide/oligopeptide/nickel transport system ATPase component
MARATSALRDVRLPEAMLRRYPHELSGGQAQRVAVALALALRSELLLADEPTSALDVTVQAEVLELIRDLCDKHDMAVLFVTHDLAVVSQICDRVNVMQAGRIVERGGVAETLRWPSHPYTRELVAAVPRLSGIEA